MTNPAQRTSQQCPAGHAPFFDPCLPLFFSFLASSFGSPCTKPYPLPGPGHFCWLNHTPPCRVDRSRKGSPPQKLGLSWQRPEMAKLQPVVSSVVCVESFFVCYLLEFQRLAGLSFSFVVVKGVVAWFWSKKGNNVPKKGGCRFRSS